MPKVRLNYDGWLALPASVRQKLGLSTGDQLAVEISDGAVILRPARAGAAAPVSPAEPEPMIAPPAPAPAVLQAAVAPAPTLKRGPGRPRKTPPAPVAPVLKVRGRRAMAQAPE